ncbi:MAG: hypothetical protein IT432_04195 [Phycisphaerales bacterium]|nr:hypothetical protein [Phycisphaerales bacterium]
MYVTPDQCIAIVAGVVHARVCAFNSGLAKDWFARLDECPYAQVERPARGPVRMQDGTPRCWGDMAGVQSESSNCAHVLAIAVAEAKLTREQCWEIAKYQRFLQRSCAGHVPKVLDICQIHGYLTPEQSEQILLLQTKYKESLKAVPDPLAGRDPGQHRGEWRLPLMAVVYLVVAAVSYWAYQFSAGILAIPAFILATFAFIERLSKYLFKDRIDDATLSISRAKNFVFVAVAILTIVYLLWCLHQSPSASMHARASSAGYLLVGIVFALFVMTSVRGRKIHWGEARDGLGTQLMHQLRSRRAQNGGTPEERAKFILDRTAEVMTSNVYDSWLSRLPVVWRQTICTLWYLEPEEKAPDDDAQEPAARFGGDKRTPHDLIRFRIVAASCPARLATVVQAVEKVKQSHRPAWSQSTYDSFLRECWSPQTGLDRQRVEAAAEEITRCVSLTGWVFTSGQTLYSLGHSDFDWLASGFRASVLKSGGPEVSDLLRFCSFAAIPVVGTGGQKVGVVLACRRRLHGFVASDRNSLMLAAACLGIDSESRDPASRGRRTDGAGEVA